MFFDLWGAKYTVMDNYMRYDVVNYGDYCQAAQWFLELARFQTFLQMDVNECLYGLIGSITDDTNDCEWATYYINHPLFDVNFYDYNRQGEWMTSNCGEVPNYDKATVL